MTQKPFGWVIEHDDGRRAFCRNAEDVVSQVGSMGFKVTPVYREVVHLVKPDVDWARIRTMLFDLSQRGMDFMGFQGSASEARAQIEQMYLRFLEEIEKMEKGA